MDKTYEKQIFRRDTKFIMSYRTCVCSGLPEFTTERVMKGDVLIRSQHDRQDSYRVQKAAFECTYEVITPAG